MWSARRRRQSIEREKEGGEHHVGRWWGRRRCTRSNASPAPVLQSNRWGGCCDERGRTRHIRSSIATRKEGIMYIVANRVPVAAPWREQFEERFRTRAGQIDQQPGFVRLQVLRPADVESPYVVLTTWRDKAAFEAWVGSEDFRLGPISIPCPRRPTRV